MDDSPHLTTSCSTTIHAPLDQVDLPSWCFTLPESEYLACSPAHVAAGVSSAPDGRRMSINVEVIGGILVAHHDVEDLAQPDT